MSTCWTEGDLRASLDGELEAASAALLTAHLAECASCEALRRQLAGCASRVAGLMAVLEESAPLAAIIPMPPIIPMPRRSWRGVAAIGAMAAGLAIAALTVALRPASNNAKHATATYPNPVASLPTPDVPAQHVSLTHPRHTRPEPRAAVFTPTAAPAAAQPADTGNGYFLALDDEPIETGIVMRVASPSGDFQADVIVGPDGRAHAIRIVTDGN